MLPNTIYILTGSMGTGKPFFAQSIKQGVESRTEDQKVMVFDVKDTNEVLERLVYAREQKATQVILVCGHGFYVTVTDLASVYLVGWNDPKMPSVYNVDIRNGRVP
jgi:hypothetical protein